MKFFKIFFLSVILFFNTSLFADEASDWLRKEIDIILNAYLNENISNEERFLMIEQTINENFAGTGIAKFIAGNAWTKASKETKKNYVKSFKRHLALNIASMMQGYSNQKYELSSSKIDKNKVILVNMEIFSNTGSVVVTWRLKEAKNRLFVIDLLVADISLVVTKRSEFNSMLKNVDNDLSKLNDELHKTNESSYQKIIN
jgi:ABC-type transporter MlaC component